MNIKKLALAKLRAVLIHFAISVLIFLPFVYLIVFHWYPVPLFFTDGGWQGLRIMAMVDLVLGPTLTLMAYNPAKSRRELVLDFSCIALAQLAALSYGVTTVHGARPWAIAYHDGALHVTAHEAYKEQTIEPGTWAALGSGPPYRVYVRAATTPDEKEGIAAFGILNGTGPEGLAFLYEPLDRHLEQMRAAALEMPKLAASDPALKRDYEALLQEHTGQSLWFLPLDGYFSEVIVALDSQGSIVDTLYHQAPR